MRKPDITAREASHANQCGYSDVHPYEIVAKQTDSKMTVREMDATIDPAWKMDFHPGGFFGHVSNDRSQRWTYASNPERPIVIIRQHKDGRWFDKYGGRYALAMEPYKFHDHNF